MARRVRISKLVSLLLRHRPDLGGLSPDERGFVPLDDLLDSVVKIMREKCSREEVLDVIMSDEERFEVVDGMVRARYGHSFTVTYDRSLPLDEVPDILYHGTTLSSLGSILREGLKPMGRGYVHLSLTKERALKVAKRRKGPHVILRIRARDLARYVPLYRPSRLTFLVKRVPPEYIEVEEVVRG
ncbi:MAG: RNA 2'-phosphotransferase [Candidatus Korarchaeota archaeon]|nr:RNA 2'-phosphotransferase [Candidatus Korarchaeota archaeon]